MSSGTLIVFEGADEVGKTTLVGVATEYFKRRGGRVRQLAFPGQNTGTLGAHVYNLHHHPKECGIIAGPSPASLQALHIASHLDAIERVILPALGEGEIIVLDRYWWSTWVYGLVSGADSALLARMIAVEKSCWGDSRPDVVFLVTRSAPLNSVENVADWLRIRREYEALAQRERSAQRVVLIPNENDMQSAVRSVIRQLDALRGIAENAHARTRAATDTVSSGDSETLPLDKTFDLFDAGASRETPADDKSTYFNVHIALAPTRPTEVYDTYWRFAAERQAIFFRKQSRATARLTVDPILATHKFTNVYRASDRVSQYLIRNVIYSGDQTPNELFFRILIFKTFNRIGTWKLLEEHLGEIRWSDYAFTKYDQILSKALAAGDKIYSAAYIMSTGRSAFGFERKHRNHLQMIEAMMRADVPVRLPSAGSMQDVFELLMTFPSIGSFLAYQYAIDLNYSTLTNFSEMEFVVPGPGARNGIRKCFHDFGGLTEADLIRRVADLQEGEFERLGLEFQDLWGRRLQLIDCQNLFCEVDKYARVAHPGATGVTGRTRIKQKYRPTPTPINYWYPPKWGLNERIAKGAPRVSHV